MRDVDMDIIDEPEAGSTVKTTPKKGDIIEKLPRRIYNKAWRMPHIHIAPACQGS